MDEAEQLRTKISEIKQRVAFQQAVKAEMSERLRIERERDQKIQREIRDIKGIKRVEGGLVQVKVSQMSEFQVVKCIKCKHNYYPARKGQRLYHSGKL